MNELEHENDIEAWIADIKRMKDEFRKIRLIIKTQKYGRKTLDINAANWRKCA
jgi:hypothetical protein